MSTVDYKSIGTKIRQARAAKQLSQEQLAEMCDISVSFLGHIERGTRKMSLETFHAVCIALHLSPSYLLFSEETTMINNVFTFDLDALNTKDPDKIKTFTNAISALAAGIEKL